MASALALSAPANTRLTYTPTTSATTHLRKKAAEGNADPGKKIAFVPEMLFFSWGSRSAGFSMGPATSWGK